MAQHLTVCGYWGYYFMQLEAQLIPPLEAPISDKYTVFIQAGEGISTVDFLYVVTLLHTASVYSGTPIYVKDTDFRTPL